MGWGITGAVLILLTVLPLGIWVSYDAEGPLVRLVTGPVNITLYPRPKKENKSAEKEKTPSAQKKDSTQDPALPKPPKAPAPEKPPKETGKGGSITDFFPFVKLGLDLLTDLRRKLRVDELYLRLILASPDPCDLAISYGRAWAALGNLMPQLERLFVIKKRDVELECDFTASKTLVTARVQITITLGRLLALLAVFAVRGLKEFLHFKKIRKGGAVK